MAPDNKSTTKPDAASSSITPAQKEQLSRGTENQIYEFALALQKALQRALPAITERDVNRMLELSTEVSKDRNEHDKLEKQVKLLTAKLSKLPEGEKAKCEEEIHEIDQKRIRFFLDFDRKFTELKGLVKGLMDELPKQARQGGLSQMAEAAEAKFKTTRWL